MALREEDVRVDHATEGALARRANCGDAAAFDELYRRHVDAAWRLAVAVTRNPDDAADVVADAFAKVFTVMRAGRFNPDSPFRGYLLVTTRNTAIDLFRRRKREAVTDSGDVIDLVDPARGPAAWIDADADASLVGAAFVGLPERWRSILWLTEVEGLAPRDAAPIIGLSPNATAQLAVRARRGLRERYARAHLAPADDLVCRRAVDRLAGFSAGTLSEADDAKVRTHLDACCGCRERLAELDDVNSRLRHFALPVPLVLIDRARTAWVSNVERFSAGTDFTAVAERAVAAGSIVAAAAGVVAAAFIGTHPSTPETALARPEARFTVPIDVSVDLATTPRDLAWPEPVVVITGRPDARFPAPDEEITTASLTATVSPGSFDGAPGAATANPVAPATGGKTPLPTPPVTPPIQPPVAPPVETPVPAPPVVEVDDGASVGAPPVAAAVVEPDSGSAAVTVGPVTADVQPAAPAPAKVAEAPATPAPTVPVAPTPLG